MATNTPTVGQKTLRSLGLTVFLVTLLFVLGLAYSASSGSGGSQLKRIGLMVAALAAAVALAAMLVDAFDLWVRGRRMTPFSVKMFHSLVFVCMLATFILTLFVPGAALMLTLTPALLIYLFAVVRKPAPAAAPRGPSRQRRGGRKHK